MKLKRNNMGSIIAGIGVCMFFALIAGMWIDLEINLIFSMINGFEFPTLCAFIFFTSIGLIGIGWAIPD